MTPRRRGLARLVDVHNREVRRVRLSRMFPWLWDCVTGKYYDRRPSTRTYVERRRGAAPRTRYAMWVASSDVFRWCLPRCSGCPGHRILLEAAIRDYDAARGVRKK